MRSSKRIIFGSLLIASMGSAAQAQVVLNMPPPKARPVEVATVQTPDQQAESVQVGEVALTRYAQRRSRPRANYRYGGLFGQPYGYYNYYPYSYGYYPFYGGFGRSTFGHTIHHHHNNHMGGGAGD